MCQSAGSGAAGGQRSVRNSEFVKENLLASRSQIVTTAADSELKLILFLEQETLLSIHFIT